MRNVPWTVRKYLIIWICTAVPLFPFFWLSFPMAVGISQLVECKHSWPHLMVKTGKVFNLFQTPTIPTQFSGSNLAFCMTFSSWNNQTPGVIGGIYPVMYNSDFYSNYWAVASHKRASFRQVLWLPLCVGVLLPGPDFCRHGTAVRSDSIARATAGGFGGRRWDLDVEWEWDMVQEAKTEVDMQR